MSARLKWSIAALSLVVAISAWLAVWLTRSPRIDAAGEARLSRMRTYCDAVSAGFDLDSRDLGGENEKHRVEASDRFGGQVTYHSEQELQLCADHPPDLTGRDGCWLRKDYACLARLARAASDAARMRK